MVNISCSHDRPIPPEGPLGMFDTYTVLHMFIEYPPLVKSNNLAGLDGVEITFPG